MDSNSLTRNIYNPKAAQSLSYILESNGVFLLYDSLQSIMEAYMVDSGDPSMLIMGFKNPNISVITPLIDFLERNDNVEYVRYIEKHPELEDIQLLLKVKEGNDPKSIIISSLSEMESYFGDTIYTNRTKKEDYAKSNSGSSGNKKLFADGN